MRLACRLGAISSRATAIATGNVRVLTSAAREYPSRRGWSRTRLPRDRDLGHSCNADKRSQRRSPPRRCSTASLDPSFFCLHVALYFRATAFYATTLVHHVAARCREAPHFRSAVRVARGAGHAADTTHRYLLRRLSVAVVVEAVVPAMRRKVRGLTGFRAGVPVETVFGVRYGSGRTPTAWMNCIGWIPEAVLVLVKIARHRIRDCTPSAAIALAIEALFR
jgi:hypothetical protein